MQVGMGHFETDNRKAAAVAFEGTFDSMRDRFGKQHQAGQEIVGQIKEPVYLRLRHHERMALTKWKNIQEGKEPVIFRNLIRRYFSGNDLREKGHTVIFSILNCRVPAGTRTSATSPTCLPRRPFPIGEVTEILPCLSSASFSDTR